MSGTKQSAVQAAITNKKKYGNDFYANIGRKGGRKTGVKKGFATMSHDRLREVSAKGGSPSKRTKTTPDFAHPDSSVEVSTTIFFSKSAKVRAFLRTVAGREMV